MLEGQKLCLEEHMKSGVFLKDVDVDTEVRGELARTLGCQVPSIRQPG